MLTVSLYSMSKLHDLVSKSKKIEFTKEFSWTDATNWKTVAEKLSELEFSYILKEENSTAIIGIFNINEREDAVIFELNLRNPPIIRAVENISTLKVDTANEYRCPAQYDLVMKDTAYAISKGLIDDQACLLQDIKSFVDAKSS